MSHSSTVPVSRQSLFEQYRPSAWPEVIGQPKALAIVERLRPRGLGGRAYWIAGSTGTGKTTIARLLAAELADEINIEEVDATGMMPADVKRMERDSHYFGIGEKSGRVFIINESHGLRRNSLRQLLTTLERIPAHAAFIFTTTNAGQDSLFDEQIDAHPLLSRCIEIPLARRGLTEAFAERAQEIAQAENLDGQPIAAYVRLLKNCRNNFRDALTKIEAGAMLAD